MSLPDPPARPALVKPLPHHLALGVGVTGHRDLRPTDVPALEACVAALLDDVRRQFPHTPTQFYSQLAEGADRLAARVAIGRGWTLIAVLPMAVHEYEKDFETEASRAEFGELLTAAADVVTIPPGDAAGLSPAGGDRDEFYFRAGALINNRCHVLLALWDGGPGSGRGGTAEVVRAKLDGSFARAMPDYRLLDSPEPGAVYHVLTPRTRTPDDAVRPVTGRWLSNEADRGASVPSPLAALRPMDDYNKDAAAEAAGMGDGADAPLLPAGQLTALPPQLLAVQAKFHVADRLALRHQRSATRFFRLMTVLGLAAILCNQLHVHASSPGGGLKAMFWALVAVTYLIYLVSRHQRLQPKYLEYRTLAEAFRIQFYWAFAGVRHNVVRHYPRRTWPDLEWIRPALRGGFEPLADDPGDSDAAARVTAVQQAWVAPQQRFYTLRTAQRRKQIHLLNSLNGGLVALGLAATVFIAVLGHRADGGTTLPAETSAHVIAALIAAAFAAGTMLVVFASRKPPDSPPWRRYGMLAGAIAAVIAAIVFGHRTRDIGTLHELLETISFLAPAIAAVSAWYLNLMAFEPHARLYERMARLFTRAQTVLAEQDPADVGLRRTLMQELGEESLGENADWLAAHRQRPWKAKIR